MERLKKGDRLRQHRQRVEHAAASRNIQAKPPPPAPPSLPISCDPPEPDYPPYNGPHWMNMGEERRLTDIVQWAWREVRASSVWHGTVWALRARAHVRRRLRILKAWDCNAEAPRKGCPPGETTGTSLRHEVVVEISGQTGSALRQYDNSWKGLEYVDECAAECTMTAVVLGFLNTAGKVFSVLPPSSQDGAGQTDEQARFGKVEFSKAAIRRRIGRTRNRWRVEWVANHDAIGWLEDFPAPRPDEDFGGSSKEEQKVNARSAYLQRTRCVMLVHALEEIGGEDGLRRLLRVMKKRMQRSDGLAVKLMIAQRYASASDFTGIPMSPEQISRFIKDRGWWLEKEEWIHDQVGSGTFHTEVLNEFGHRELSPRLKEEEAEVDGEHVWTAVFQQASSNDRG